MREIKFRAWNKYHKKMYNVYELCLDDKVALCHQNSNHTFGFIDLELLQFTGLKDKNGKEIYEDDIVKLVHRKSEKGGWYSNKLEVGRVVFDMKWGVKFNCRDLTQRVSQHWKSELDCFSDASDVVVIGNIYENPELLTTT